ncbi:hypothetical protein MHLP_03295 [Candidatus Mycoplasma haematolamae str. Purdue]|uniref:Uncharacterized protein n=1 Tax=Mycoplasma haematolamae (strain Purdue) TaxID=1212765 RepID=I7CK31_MYCHA|nr:hypothetical protein MHLP_03295 [Candidatus Mycoplasma haematolamae str. Purdue]
MPPPAQKGRQKRSAKSSQPQEELASEKAKKELEDVKKELEKMTQNIESSWKNLLGWQQRITDEKQTMKFYEAALDFSSAFIEAQKVVLKGKIARDTKDSEGLVQKINTLTSFMVKASKALEDLKAHHTTLKYYEGKISTSLCGLKTISRAGCSSPAEAEIM